MKETAWRVRASRLLHAQRSIIVMLRLAVMLLPLLAADTDSGRAAPSLVFVAKPSNDIVVAARNGNLPTHVFDTVAAAVAAASVGDGLLVMAEGMQPADPGVPQNASATGVRITEGEWADIQAKGLTCYLEFPSQIPGTPEPLVVAQTLYERVAVSARRGIRTNSGTLEYLELLHPHKLVDFVVLPPELLAKAELVLAKVAGYDTACFGLPAQNDTWSFLVSATPKLLLAATQLSYCRRVSGAI